jgi:hypothetical protein
MLLTIEVYIDLSLCYGIALKELLFHELIIK